MKKRTLLLIGISLVLLLAACQSAESKEVMEYHNDFVEKVITKGEEVSAGYAKMESVETEEETLEIIQDEMLPALQEMKKHMEDQDPKEDESKEYHQLRLEWFKAYHDLIETELQAMDDYINDVITEEEFDNISESLYDDLDEVNERAEKADKKIDELAEKYDFEELDE